MAILKTKESKQKSVANTLWHRLDNLMHDDGRIDDPYLKNLPQELKDKLKAFKKEISEYKSEETITPQEIQGQILTSEEILAIIIEVTQNIKWDLDDETLLNKEISKLKENFGISFKEKNIYKYRYYYKTSNRDAINALTIISLPGYVEVSTDTDRYGETIEKLMTPKEFKSYLLKEFSE